LVIDAGCDPKFEFSDLGNAVRKCCIDFGARIEFLYGLDDIASGRSRVAVAKITYASSEESFEASDVANEEGTLVYIKPAILREPPGREPADVLSYFAEHAEFPHETTADQFFTESQFESYRRLGLFSVASTPEFSRGSAAEVFEAFRALNNNPDRSKLRAPQGQ
jgi:hypothetical protein